MRTGELGKAPRRRHALGLMLAAFAALTAVVGCSSSSHRASTGETTTAAPEVRGTEVASPEVSGPIEGGKYGLPFNPMPAQLADQYGYEEQEYFFRGTATAYQPVGDWTADGRWSVSPTTTAPYETRLLVRRPTDPAKFNGTVIVEWLNVTSGMDADPDFGFAHDELMRDGFAYVGVSAQAAGVIGGGPKIDIAGVNALPLKQWDPERYAPLSHPGDDYSYDIFSQAAQAVRQPDGVNPLDGLTVQRVVATGESQSAGRMTTYVNAIQPVADIYDGFVIHSRGGTGAVLTAGGASMPKNAHIRDDLHDPVMMIATETDLFGLGFYGARQPDTDRIRTWELAGTSHADQTTLDYGVESGRQYDTTTQLSFLDQCGKINDGPQRFIVRDVFAALNAWIVEGTEPPHAEPMQVVNGAIARDQNGNALGGVRTPAVDVPISSLSGEQTPGTSVICSLFGSSRPFDAAELTALYPTHQQYVDDVTAAADSAVQAGFVLPPDRDEMVADAREAPIPS